MIKVKLLTATSECEEEFVGGVYEAFIMTYDNGETNYYTQVKRDMIYIFAPEQCEVIEEVASQVPEEKSTDAMTNRVLMVEDGSVDIDALEEYCEDKGIYVLVYRQGSNKPEFLS